MVAGLKTSFWLGPERWRRHPCVIPFFEGSIVVDLRSSCYFGRKPRFSGSGGGGSSVSFLCWKNHFGVLGSVELRLHLLAVTVHGGELFRSLAMLFRLLVVCFRVFGVVLMFISSLVSAFGLCDVRWFASAMSIIALYIKRDESLFR